MKTIEQVIAIFGGKPEDYERHSKGGGWKKKTAYVDATAYLGPDVIVFGSAQVFGSAWEKTPLQIRGSRQAVYWAKKGFLGIGCQVHPVEYWMENYKEIGKSNEYTDAQIKEYGRHIRYFFLWHKEELKASK